MNFVKSSLAVALVAVALGATGASATRVSNGDCIKLSTRVNQALKANSGSSSLAAAYKEQSLGAYYCGMDSYQKGIDHYNQALTLLGQK